MGEPAGSMLQELAGRLSARAEPASFLDDLAAAGGGPGMHMWRRAHAALDKQQPAQLMLPAQALRDLCWEKLHTGPWKDVHVAWRNGFTLAALLLTAVQLATPPAKSPGGTPEPAPARPLPSPSPAGDTGGAAPAAAGAADAGERRVGQLGSLLRELDMAAMMGGPRFKRLLDWATQQLEAALAALEPAPGGRGAAAASGTAAAGWAPGEPPPQPPPPLAAAARALLPPGSLAPVTDVLPVEQVPPLEHFLAEYMLADGGAGQPVVITGATDHWPARARWADPGYLRAVAGRRTVPVELGAHYLAEGWGTQLMTLADFIDGHVLAAGRPGAAGTAAAERGEGGGGAAAGGELQSGGQAARAPARRGYLAQHALFDQIPALAADIATPDWCCLGDGDLKAVNAWFGPAGTVTPLHHDPPHNLLAQVVGDKYVRLYAPVHSAALYPYAEGLTTNSSRVDLEAPDEAAFPAFRGAPFADVVLRAGDMLYIPPGWWHFVKALTISFSVSFWWA